jgi:tetratricopeptide (TPR) repeat protein
MTPEEIELLSEEMTSLRDSDPARAFELSARVIAESIASGYERCLPTARLNRADGFRRVAKYDEAIEEFERAIAISRKLGDRLNEGRATNGRGIVAKRQEDFPLAKEYAERAVGIAHEAKDSLGKGLALYNLSDIFETWGNYDQATEYAQASYELLRGTPKEYLPLYELANLVQTSGDDESALALYQRVLDLLAARDDKSHIGAAYSQIGSIYFDRKEYVRARDHYQIEGDISRAVGNLDGIAHSLQMVADCEIELGEFDSAEEKLHSAFRIKSEIGHSGKAGSTLLSFATLETKRGNAMRALDYLSGSETRTRAIGDREGDLDLHEAYSAAYEQLGDWQKVAYHEKERRRMSEEINSSRFKSQLSAAQTLLATEREKKETDMQRLRAEQSERELSNSTLALLAQTELLSELRNDILQIVRKIPPSEPAAKELRERLKNLPCQSVDWKRFDTQFKAAHPDFVKKLIELHPDLTPQEVRISALLRMNLKSEEIARLFCLSARSIENHRFRIRRKFGLAREVDLVIYLSKI